MYIWEVPRSSQDSSERYDLTLNVWEGEKAGCVLIGSLVGPKSVMESFSNEKVSLAFRLLIVLHGMA